MEKIAVISDIHGNLTALQTVLDHIDAQGISRIFCLGDIVAKGTHSEECVQLVRKKCEIVIQGNCDDFFSSGHDFSRQSELAIRRIRWNQEKLSEESRAWLHSLPFAWEFFLSGRLVRLLHSHPTRNDAYVGSFDSLSEQFGMFLPSDKTPSDRTADIVIYGHLHLPFMQKLYHRVLLNAGSVGNSIDCIRSVERDGDPRNTTVINYLILKGEFGSRCWEDELSYEWFSLPYDYEKELAANADNIEREEYEQELRRGWYRDMAKVWRLAAERKK